MVQAVGADHDARLPPDTTAVCLCQFHLPMIAGVVAKHAGTGLVHKGDAQLSGVLHEQRVQQATTTGGHFRQLPGGRMSTCDEPHFV